MAQTMKIKISFLLLFFSFNTHAFDTLTEDDYLSDIPIVLSASRLSQPESEASTTITVITRDMIDRSTAENIPDLLRLVPGFQVGYYDGNIPVVTYHGMTDQYSRRIQVLIDGRSLYIPIWGGVPWASLPITMDEIERIEVTRGPNASTYGSNSFLAVISIKTYNAYDTQGNYLRVINGNNKHHQTLYRIGTQTENAEYRITLAHRGDEGLEGVSDSNDENLLKLRLDYTFENNSQLSYQTGVNSKVFTEHGNDTSPTHEFDTVTSYHHIKWENTLNTNSSLSLQYYNNKYDLNNMVLSSPITGDDIDLTIGGVVYTFNEAFALLSLPPLDPFTVPIGFSSYSERHDFEFNYYYSPNDFLRTIAGASLREDIVKSESLFNTSEEFKTNIYRAFGHIEWKINKKFILNSGLMVEDNEIYDTSYSPRLALTHKITEQQSVRFSVSTATRAPSTAEESIEIVYYPELHISGIGICDPLFAVLALTCEPGTDDTLAYPGIISPGNLDYEKIVSTEIGYYGAFFKNKIDMNAKFFHDEISDLIVDISNGEFDNAPGEINVTGIEYALKYKPNAQFNLYFNYTKIDLEDNLDRTLIAYEDFSDAAPSDSYSLTLFSQFDKLLSGSIEYINVGTMRWVDNRIPIDELNILNLKLTYKIKLRKSTLKTSFVFKNLSGKINDYGEFGTIPDSLSGKTALIDIELLNF